MPDHLLMSTHLFVPLIKADKIAVKGLSMTKTRAASLFIFFTYCITWAIKGPEIADRYGFLTIHVSKMLDMVSTLSPGIVAIILAWIISGRKGLAVLLKPILSWRIGIRWYLIVMVFGILFTGMTLLIFNAFTHHAVKLESPAFLLFYFLLILPLSALWEETGWRGFLLPVLQEKLGPMQSSLAIGFIWGVWHLPVYIAANPYGDKTLLFWVWMFVGCFPLSILLTWLYNSSRGSLLICILFHNAINASAAYFYGNIPGSDFRPFELLVILLAVTAFIVSVKTKGDLNYVTRKAEMAGL